MNVQLVMAVLLCAAGLILIFSGFWVAPTGEIHNEKSMPLKMQGTNMLHYQKMGFFLNVKDMIENIWLQTSIRIIKSHGQVISVIIQPI